MTRLPALAAALLAVAAMPLVATPTAAQAAPAPVRYLQANIGNINVGACNDVAVKICLAPVEDRAVASLRRIDPDVVAIQEVLPDICDRAGDLEKNNPNHLCGGARRAGNMIDRLLPPGVYDTRCNTSPAGASIPIPAWDCFGVKRSRGSITTYDTRPAADPATCDNGFTVNIATLQLDGRTVQATSAHPQSGQGTGMQARDRCRTIQLTDLFGALPRTVPTIVSGDFNLDPYRASDMSTAVFNANIGLTGKPFVARSGAAEDAANPPFSSNICGASQADSTGLVLDGANPPVGGCASTLDHVATTPDVTGPCLTLNGTSAGRARVDGGGGMDHSGISCVFAVSDGPTPVVPEVPFALLLPVAAVAAGTVAVRRRRA